MQALRNETRGSPRWQTVMLMLWLVLMLGVGPGCENRKKRCEGLFKKIAACAPTDQKPSDRARLDFISRCQKEYEGAHVKRARACVSKYADCSARRKCLVKKLKLDPGSGKSY